MRTLAALLVVTFLTAASLPMIGCSPTEGLTDPERDDATTVDKNVREKDIKFAGEGSFASYFDESAGLVVFHPPGGFDLLNVSHFGLSQVAWEIRVVPATFEFVDGWFTITGANGRDGLAGLYSDFQLGDGTYDLEWLFTGGTGRFVDAAGTGHTDGIVDLATGFAEFEFRGTITY